LPQEGAALRELLVSHAVGQKAVMTNSLEAALGNMQEQASKEFHGIECPGA
jgi:hypothetical protein